MYDTIFTIASLLVLLRSVKIFRIPVVSRSSQASRVRRSSQASQVRRSSHAFVLTISDIILIRCLTFLTPDI